MSKLQFRCTLLTDLIINHKAATVGNQETLDFIPGNNFLGIVAGAYQNLSTSDQLTIFHSGKVRFGDAHPLCDGFRTLRIPAVMHYPKGGKVSESCYLSHIYNKDREVREKGENTVPQLKQSRKGFYRFQNNTAQEISIAKSFAIKSAYDRNARKSQDAQMFGYQSINEGNIFCFEVDIDDSPENLEPLKTIITEKLVVGEKQIGRSRTAQYGLVKIEAAPYEEVQSNPVIDKNMITVYADGRLIFLDDNGIPTFTPNTASQLGFPGGKIIWDKSQIRTFQYAPWNSKRQVRDTDRCGIEKGSVFVLSVNEIPETLPEYIGSYKNEGFGKVIVNPDFLTPEEDTNGLPLYTFIQKKETATVEPDRQGQKNKSLSDQDKVLLEYLQQSQQKDSNNQKIYESVRIFMKNNGDKFISDSESFASQWGTVWNIALQYEDIEQLRNKLFKEKVGYLRSGIAEEKWNTNNRRELFGDFYNGLKPEIARLAVINLAAEMAKKCSSHNNRKGGNRNG